jgi:hypothetical protein
MSGMFVMHGEVINAYILVGYSRCSVLEIKHEWDNIKIFVKKTVFKAWVGFSWPKTESVGERDIEVLGIYWPVRGLVLSTMSLFSVVTFCQWISRDMLC